MTIDRRHFLKSAAAMAGATTFSGLGATIGGFNAKAANISGYRAIVCVFFLGGLDCHDMLIPMEQGEYDEYDTVRRPLLSLYEGTQGGNSRALNRLLPLTLQNATNFPGRQFGLVPDMPNLHNLFENGQAAIIGNVGPLLAPSTRQLLESEAVQAPKRLFSHNDQQSTWVSSAPEGAQFGIGGRFADAVLASNANMNRQFTAISTLGNELFLTGEFTAPYQIGVDGPAEIDVIRYIEPYRQYADVEARYQALRAHFSQSQFSSQSILERDFSDAMRTGFETNEQFRQARESMTPLITQFPATGLGQQLRAVAEAVSLRDVLEVNRQVFMVGIGGFDTHSAQPQDLPALLTQIDDAVAAFHMAMTELNTVNDVTLFTASDFGRTLSPNGDGTDHGWGGHHFVVGGGIQGGHLFGGVPAPIFDHDYDAGNGRLIPQVSIEEMVAPMGRWFGLSEPELAAALPNLGAFPSGGIALY